MRKVLLPLAYLALSSALLGASCESSTPDQCEVNPDVDGDGYNSIDCAGADCDDTDAERSPGRAEVRDAADVDEDCDPTTFGDRDTDGDGYVDVTCANIDSEGTESRGDDCDDLRQTVHPDATEACDLMDNDCDIYVDEGVLIDLYADEDLDGYGAGDPTQGCFLYEGVSFLGNDCDDANPAIVPGAMQCNVDLSDLSYSICLNTGLWEKASNCPTSCEPQPNGTGVCL